MPQMIQVGRELIRINPTTKAIEWSTNEGRAWHIRYRTSSSVGEFQEIYRDGRELLAQTSKGLFWSTDNGRSWHLRKRN